MLKELVRLDENGKVGRLGFKDILFDPKKHPQFAAVNDLRLVARVMLGLNKQPKPGDIQGEQSPEEVFLSKIDTLEMEDLQIIAGEFADRMMKKSLGDMSQLRLQLIKQGHEQNITSEQIVPQAILTEAVEMHIDQVSEMQIEALARLETAQQRLVETESEIAEVKAKITYMEAEVNRQKALLSDVELGKLVASNADNESDKQIKSKFNAGASVRLRDPLTDNFLYGWFVIKIDAIRNELTAIRLLRPNGSLDENGKKWVQTTSSMGQVLLDNFDENSFIIEDLKFASTFEEFMSLFSKISFSGGNLSLWDKNGEFISFPRNYLIRIISLVVEKKIGLNSLTNNYGLRDSLRAVLARSNPALLAELELKTDIPDCDLIYDHNIELCKQLMFEAGEEPENRGVDVDQAVIAMDQITAIIDGIAKQGTDLDKLNPDDSRTAEIKKRIIILFKKIPYSLEVRRRRTQVDRDDLALALERKYGIWVQSLIDQSVLRR